MIPATTIWNGGLRYENSIFHRQKFVWRRQAGCQIIPVPCVPCKLVDQLFETDCQLEYATCLLYPEPPYNNFGYLLNEVITESGVDLDVCDPNSITSTWTIIIRIGSDLKINRPFFTGYGLATPTFSYPDENQWLLTINDALVDLFNDGFGYILNQDPAGPSPSDSITIYNLDCYPDHIGKFFTINVRVNFTINCQ
jgi:hypothetical protein